MSELNKNSPEVENRYHNYTSSRIPWYVRLIWLGYWGFAIYYTVIYLFPAIQTELFLRQ